MGRTWNVFPVWREVDKRFVFGYTVVKQHVAWVKSFKCHQLEISVVLSPHTHMTSEPWAHAAGLYCILILDNVREL